MQLSDSAAFDAAAEHCAVLAQLAPATRIDPAAIAEAIVQTGVALLVRQMGVADATAYVVSLLSVVIREDANGH